jgi:hypothetical protein
LKSLRNLRLPVALILLVGLVLAALLMLLSARYAKAPEPTLSLIEKQAQGEAETGKQAVTATSVASGLQDRNLAEAPGATRCPSCPTTACS